VIAGEHAAGARVPERYRQLAASSEFVCALTSELFTRINADSRKQAAFLRMMAARTA
jgi:uncharacterized protein YpuA (DUF1002 family)